MSKQKKTVIQKIEFDNQTKEPITLLINGEETPQIINNVEQEVEIEETVKNPNPKQMVMDKYLRIEKKPDVAKRQRILKNVFSIVFFVFAIGVIVGTAIHDFTSGELPTFSQIADTIFSRWYFIFIALACLGLFYICKSLKLSITCKSMTGKFRYKTCFETAIVGIYYNNITPLAVGGQPFEIYHLSKHGVNGGVASSLPIITYFFNQTAFVILGFISIFLLTSNPFGVPVEMLGLASVAVTTMAIIGLILMMAVPIIIILFSLMPRFTSKLIAGILHLGNKLKLIKNPKVTALKTYKMVIRNSRCIKGIFGRPIAFFSTFILSFFEHLASNSIAFFTLLFFGFTPTNMFLAWLMITQLSFVLSAAVSFIPTPGNAGASDLSFYAMFKVSLSTNGFAFPAMLVWRSISYYLTVIIGFSFTAFKKRSDRKHHLLQEKLKDFE